MRWTHRDHHASALAQLFKQRRRNLRCGCGDDNDVEGCVISQTVAPVADEHFHVVETKPGKCVSCRAGERLVPLHRVHLPSEFRKQSGLIARACTYPRTVSEGSSAEASSIMATM